MRPYLEKNPSQKEADGVAQGVGPEFKSQDHTKKMFQHISWGFIIVTHWYYGILI
jgi:hypothetical protein